MWRSREEFCVGAMPSCLPLSVEAYIHGATDVLHITWSALLADSSSSGSILRGDGVESLFMEESRGNISLPKPQRKLPFTRMPVPSPQAASASTRPSPSATVRRVGLRDRRCRQFRLAGIADLSALSAKGSLFAYPVKYDILTPTRTYPPMILRDLAIACGVRLRGGGA